HIEASSWRTLAVPAGAETELQLELRYDFTQQRSGVRSVLLDTRLPNQRTRMRFVTGKTPFVDEQGQQRLLSKPVFVAVQAGASPAALRSTHDVLVRWVRTSERRFWETRLGSLSGDRSIDLTTNLQKGPATTDSSNIPTNPKGQASTLPGQHELGEARSVWFDRLPLGTRDVQVHSWRRFRPDGSADPLTRSRLHWLALRPLVASLFRVSPNSPSQILLHSRGDEQVRTLEWVAPLPTTAAAITTLRLRPSGTACADQADLMLALAPRFRETEDAIGTWVAQQPNTDSSRALGQTAHLKLALPADCDRLILIGEAGGEQHWAVREQRQRAAPPEEADWLFARQSPAAMTELFNRLTAAWRADDQPRSTADSSFSVPQPRLDAAIDRVSARVTNWLHQFEQSPSLRLTNPHCRGDAAQGAQRSLADGLASSAAAELMRGLPALTGARCRKQHLQLAALLANEGSGMLARDYWRTLMRQSGDPTLAWLASEALLAYANRVERWTDARATLSWQLATRPEIAQTRTLGLALLHQGNTTDALTLMLLHPQLPESEALAHALIDRDWLMLLAGELDPQVLPAGSWDTPRPRRFPSRIRAANWQTVVHAASDREILRPQATHDDPVLLTISGPAVLQLEFAAVADEAGATSADEHWIDITGRGIEQPLLLPATNVGERRLQSGGALHPRSRVLLKIDAGQDPVTIRPRGRTSRVIVGARVHPADFNRPAGPLPATQALVGTAVEAQDHPWRPLPPITATQRAEIDLAKVLGSEAPMALDSIAIADAFALAQRHSDVPRVERYRRWLTNRTHWQPWSLITSSAGLRTQTSFAADRISSRAKHQSLFLPSLAAGELPLYDDRQLNFTLDTARAETVRLVLSHRNRFTNQTAVVGYRLQVNGSELVPGYLTSDREDVRHLELAAGTTDIAVQALTRSAGTELRVQLQRESAPGHWSPVITPRSTTFHQGTTTQPLAFSLTGPRWIRIDRLTATGIISEERQLDAQEHLAFSDGAVRLYQRIARPAVTLNLAQPAESMLEPKLEPMRGPVLQAQSAPQRSDANTLRSPYEITYPWRQRQAPSVTLAQSLVQSWDPVEQEESRRELLTRLFRRQRHGTASASEWVFEHRQGDATDAMQRLGLTFWQANGDRLQVRKQAELRSDGTHTSLLANLRLRLDHEDGPLALRSELAAFGAARINGTGTSGSAVWTAYRDDHPSGVSLQQRLRWLPYRDLALYGEYGLRSNADWSTAERGHLRMGLRTQRGRWQWGVTADHRHYFADEHREETTAISRLMLNARWFLPVGPGFLEVSPRIGAINEGQLEAALTIGWTQDRNQGLYDLHSDRLWFQSLIDPLLLRQNDAHHVSQ
ncbi:MAG: hypothetical protein AAF648_05090, partial [Pseudomonadota bacterium]